MRQGILIIFFDIPIRELRGIDLVYNQAALIILLKEIGKKCVVYIINMVNSTS